MTWTVGRRIATAFSFILALLALMALTAHLALSRVSRELTHLDQMTGSVLESSSRARGAIRDAERALLNHLLSGEEEDLRLRSEFLAQAAVALQEMRNDTMLSARRAGIDSATAMFAAWRTASDALVEVSRAQGLTEARTYRDRHVPPALFRELREYLDAQIRSYRQLGTEQTTVAVTAASRARSLLLISGGLALAFGILTAILLGRAVSGPLRETTSVLASGAAEILAATTQQATGAAQTSAAVTETVTTVNEVAVTADQAAERAREIERASRRALDESVAAMEGVQEQMASVAGSILALAEQAQAIGEIITSVNDMAEQSNLLALNAAVEAARAGEHGRGFAVVAGEVKSLAGQSKQATTEIRRILGDVQRATSAAVMATEQGTKAVASASRQVTDVVGGTAQAAAQIVGSAGQQAVGMAQIRQAMADIQDATQQNLASTRQAERAAQDLNQLGDRLVQLVGGSRAVGGL